MLMARMFTAQEPGTMEYKTWKTNNRTSFSNKKKKRVIKLREDTEEPQTHEMREASPKWHSGKGRTREPL